MRPELLAKLLSLLPQHHTRPELQLLDRMLRDYPQRGGKGLRSELLLLSAQAHGLSPSGQGWEAAQWLAVTLELFQNWVLIHDDIVDDSEERRGRPALHREYGVALALNAGDALHAYMWAALAQAMRLAPEASGSLMDEVLTMIHRTAEGQHIDLAWVQAQEWALSEADYLEMVRLKTAWYTVIVPLRLGALAAGQTPASSFEEAGLALGAAFQIRDDVLNLRGEAATYGKEIGGDLLEGKRTLMTLHWLAQADAAQRQYFLDMMSLPRPAKTLQQLATVLGWLRESGSLDYAQGYAAEEGERGLELLRSALLSLPEQPAAAQILSLVESYVTRHA